MVLNQDFSGYQVAPTVRGDEAIVRSCEEPGLVFGTVVGESSLRRAYLLLFSRSTIAFSCADAWSSAVWKNQALLCALKSPTIRVSSSWELSSVDRFRW